MRRLLTLAFRAAGHSPLNRGKFRLALWAYAHLRPLPSPQTVRLINGLLREIDPNEFVQNQIYYLGAYELYLARFFRSLLRAHSVFADVGAHVGQYTLLAAGAGMTVHAFEPNPHNFGRLRPNVELNHLSAVTLNQCAIADESGERGFDLPDEGNTGSGTLGAPDGFRVYVRTLDEYFGSGAALPDIIKMDIEGAELLALQGADAILKNRPALFLEANAEALARFGTTRVSLLAHVRARGYGVHVLERDRLCPFDGAREASNYDNLICLPV